MYNIVYSIIFHQDLDYVNYYLRRLEKYNVNNNFLVIIHVNEKLYNIKDKIYKKNVIINPIYKNKNINGPSSDIMKAWIENFEYLISNKIEFLNLMILSSSGLWIRQAPKFENNNNLKMCKNEFIQKDLDKLYPYWYHWKNILKNKKIIKLFQDNKIQILNTEISGNVYSKQVFYKITEFIRMNNFFELIEEETVFGEFVLDSLANYYLGDWRLTKNYCHVFRNFEKDIPDINSVVNMLKERPDILIFKRIPADLNHDFFKIEWDKLF